MKNIRKSFGFLSGFREGFSNFFESIRRLIGGKKADFEEKAEEILKIFGIKRSDDGYSELKGDLIAILSNQEDAEKFSNWAKKSSSVLGEKIDSFVDKKEQEFKKKHEKKMKEFLIPTIKDAINDGILTVADGDIVEILRCLQEENSPQALEKSLDFEISEIESIINWLDTLGIIKRSSTGESSGKVFFKISSIGRRILSESQGQGEEIKWDEQIYCLAFSAAGDKEDAEKLLRRLFGGWGRRHRGVLEKLKKEMGASFERMSKYFWEKMEGGHSKHIGIKISNHEASGMLLCLRLSSFHVRERISELQGPINPGVFGKASFRKEHKVPA
ncbi:hypothetical protein AKJ54_00220 [candidate division MSBL1 archaeon SCGC-AAA382K21]|uniref:Uncharacterized protein n=1 Tax=candidate division MSBL1 archaeon SCGC-AAA382K21 TaxID=1698283 RepID=A0A133VM27_9EURY|nr:hypothetical protein AKJ54_00220 [candidate division MSBL1 archaeon SCGC-AAA382K21]